MKKLPLWLANLSKATDMTTGDVMRTVTSFAIPVMIGSLFRLIDPPEDIMDGAISTFAAQNYGKGVKKSMLIPVLISLGLTGFIFLFGKYFMLLFVGAEETGILEPSLLYMRITSIFQAILGVNFIVRFALTGVGKSIIPMLVGVTETLSRAAVTYLLVYRVRFLRMTFASPACWSTSTLLCALCYAPMMKSAAKALQKEQV